jgi:beta-mannosidase
VYEVPLAIHDLPAARWNPHNHPGARGGRKRFLLNLRLAARPEHGIRPTGSWSAAKASASERSSWCVSGPGRRRGRLPVARQRRGYVHQGRQLDPDDSFPARIDERRLRERLTQARDAGFNLLRVWGGGLYETETFYDLCDELGLMVWQDFPFACSSYPDDEEWFVEQVRAEAIAAVRRIRNHPCLALWCGGNENVELFQDRWAGKTQATEFFGDRIIHETLPAVLTAEDPGTPYWPNSPYGGDKATSEDFGDSHYWNVWHSKLPGSNGDWTNYRFSRSRFSSEFGFAAPAGPAAWAQALAPEDRAVRSAASRWHDKTRKGYETYLNFIAMHFPAPRTFDDLVYYGQMNQAEALRFGVEHWRRMKGRCWGTLFWQLNDCWPTHSWSVIDSAGAPKAAYHAARRFYAPLLLSLTRDDAAPGRVQAYLVNDTPADVQGRLLLRVLTFEGEEVTCHEQPASVAANALPAGPAAALDLPGFVRDSGTDVFVHATFGEDGENGGDTAPLAESFLLLAEPKDLRLPDPAFPGASTRTGKRTRAAGAARPRG